MEELKNMQFPSQDAASQVGLLHKEIVGKVMIYELYKAVEEGNVDNFVKVLKQKCKESKLPLSDIFDKVTLVGDSLLHVAADLGKEQIAEVIAHHFPELLTRKNERGDTVLHVAVRSKNSTIVKLILSQYAIEKSKHDDEMKDKEITRETNECGNTPLHEAVYSGHVDVVEDIFGADKAAVHCLNKSKRSPLYLAVQSGNLEILDLLLQIPFPADRSLSQSRGSSPLHAAILEKNHVMIKEIIAKRPELVYLRDEVGDTPLHYAADIGYVGGVRMLLENSLLKLDQTAFEQNKKGHLPIHLACKRGYVETVKEFFEQEWPINPYVLLNRKGQNILHIAAKNGRSNVVQYLLRNCKIDLFTINQKDNDGNTPLHLASKNLFPKVIYFITQDKRTHVNLMNKDGLTARDISKTFEIPMMHERKILSNVVLEAAGVPVKVNHMFHSQRQPQPQTYKLNKETSEAFLIVAALMVTVTFAAAFTVPGGVYSSDHPNPKLRGTAVLAHKPLFWLFTIFNMIAMFSSAMTCGLLPLGMVLPSEFTRKHDFPLECLTYAFLTAPVAFTAAVLLVVANNYSLTVATSVIGGLLTFYTVFFIFLPLASLLQVVVRFYKNVLFGDIYSRLILWELVFCSTRYSDDKPKVLLPSQKLANKDEDN